MQQFGSPPHPPPRVRCSESWLCRWTDIMIKGSSRPVADPDFPKAGVWNVPSRRIRPTCGNYTSACPPGLQQESGLISRNLQHFTQKKNTILPKRRIPCLSYVNFIFLRKGACTPMHPSGSAPVD